VGLFFEGTHAFFFFCFTNTYHSLSFSPCQTNATDCDYTVCICIFECLTSYPDQPGDCIQTWKLHFGCSLHMEHFYNSYGPVSEQLHASTTALEHCVDCKSNPAQVTESLLKDEHSVSIPMVWLWQSERTKKDVLFIKTKSEMLWLTQPTRDVNSAKAKRNTTIKQIHVRCWLAKSNAFIHPYEGKTICWCKTDNRYTHK
jgi:hypothetical protein